MMGTEGSKSVRLLGDASAKLDDAFNALRETRPVLITDVVTAAWRVPQERGYVVKPLLVGGWADRYPFLSGIDTLGPDRYVITLTRDGSDPVGALLPPCMRNRTRFPALVVAVGEYGDYMKTFAAAFGKELVALPPVWR